MVSQDPRPGNNEGYALTSFIKARFLPAKWACDTLGGE